MFETLTQARPSANGTPAQPTLAQMAAREAAQIAQLNAATAALNDLYASRFDEAMSRFTDAANRLNSRTNLAGGEAAALVESCQIHGDRVQSWLDGLIAPAQPEQPEHPVEAPVARRGEPVTAQPRFTLDEEAAGKRHLRENLPGFALDEPDENGMRAVVDRGPSWTATRRSRSKRRSRRRDRKSVV